jgi:hypothetical protein
MGSWFEFQHHHPPEGTPWNAACANFTCQQWDAKVKEIADLGMKYLVLLCTAVHFKAFYSTKILPKYSLKCDDPIGTVLTAADKYGIKFFIGGGLYGDWTNPKIISDPVASKKRLQAIEELTKLNSHYPSFYGWYWPNEAFIDPYYSEEFIQYQYQGMMNKPGLAVFAGHSTSTELYSAYVGWLSKNYPVMLKGK